MKTVGDRIQEQLEKLNMNQKQLAEKVNVQEATISRYLSNVRQPRSDIVSRIASVLNVSSDYLLGRLDEDDKNISVNELFTDTLIEEYKKNKIDLNSLPPDEMKKLVKKIVAVTVALQDN